jgi:N-acetylglucosamine-6-phosphate deacetylase
VRREGERLTLADGTLAGAHLDLAGAVRFMVEGAGCGVREALRAAALLPARFLGLDFDRGHLGPGARADLVALDDRLEPVAAWIGGVRV